MLVPVRLYRLIRAMAGDAGKFMAGKSDHLSDSLGADDSEGWLGGIVADEDDSDRSTLWRLGLWGFAAASAVTLSVLSGHLPVTAQRTQLAATEAASQSKQIESTVRQTQLEMRRLSAAIETLNSDRDRLFTRLSSLEQGLDVVTGSIRKAEEKSSTRWPNGAIPPILELPPATIAALAPPPAAPPPAPVAAPEPAPIVVAARSEPTATEIGAPPSAIQAMPIPDVQAARAADGEPAEETAVPLAEFAVDLGAANSIGGLRALWRGLLKSHKGELEGLRPLLAVHERRSGPGLQLRLIAGPIKDAADAARLCAALGEAKRECKTTAFDGQRLSLEAESEEKATPRPKPRKSTRVRQPEPPAKPPEPSSSFARMLGFR